MIMVCLCYLTVQVSWAQSDRETRLTKLIEKVDSLVALHSDKIAITDNQPFSGSLEGLFRIDYSSSDSYEVKVIEAEQEKLSRDLGLDLNAGYLENLEQGVFNVEGIFYRRRAQLELEWDILNNGYLDNRHEIRELENEKQIARYRYAGRQQSDEVDSLQLAIQHHFNQRKISLVRNYLEILKDYQKIATELYQLNYKPWEEVIEITSMRARTEVELNNLIATDRRFADFKQQVAKKSNLPLLNIEFNELLAASGFESLQDSIFTQKVGKINNEYNSWRDISLSTFIRYSYYNSTSEINISNIGNREYFSVGVNFSVPLPLLRSSNNKIAEARENLLNAELIRSKNKSRDDVYSDYSRYQTQLQQYLKIYQRFLQLEVQIEKQQQRENLNDSSYSPLVLFELLTKRYEAGSDLLAAKQDLYEILVDMREQVPDSEFSRFLYSVDPDDYFTKDRLQSSRAAYLWSNAFANISNETLKNYLKKKKVDRILLSIGNDASITQKASSFIKTANLQGMKVELMIGDNNLLMPGHDEELKNIFEKGSQLHASGIHLDVEPHTRSDWESRKEEYKEHYLQMLDKSRELSQTHGLRLSVSIPVFYDSIIWEIKERVDEIYVMAYGIISTDKMKEKLSDELSATEGNLTVAMRPDDFRDLNEFESFIVNLKNDLDVHAVAIHDVESLMKLDNIEVTLDSYEE